MPTKKSLNPYRKGNPTGYDSFGLRLPKPSPSGEGVAQRMRRATDEGYKKDTNTYSGMKQIKNSKLTPFSRTLRTNMTPEERHLWHDFLKKLPITIRRQKVIGSYIADFYCASASLVIELDGSQHRTEEGVQADKVRDEYLNSLGILVLRYSNETIHKNFYGVCADIQRHIKARQGIKDSTTFDKYLSSK